MSASLNIFSFKAREDCSVETMLHWTKWISVQILDEVLFKKTKKKQDIKTLCGS